MNRFSNEKLHEADGAFSFFTFLLFLFILLMFLNGIKSVSENTVEKQQESLETALTRSIVQCYAIEGTYPPDLDYLEEHYGLTYDDTLFFVDYQAIGANLMPDVTVIRKNIANR